MKIRYYVYCLDRLIAVIHADSAERAVSLACSKTDGNLSGLCTATPVQVRGESRRPQRLLHDKPRPLSREIWQHVAC